MYLDEETIISSHHMPLVDDGDCIDDELVIDILDVVMDNPCNDFEGLDTNVDFDESNIELNEVQYQTKNGYVIDLI